MSAETTERRAQPAWHQQESAAVLSQMQASPAGLTGSEARRRLVVHGPNELQVVRRHAAWQTLAAQFKNVLVVIRRLGAIDYLHA